MSDRKKPGRAPSLQGVRPQQQKAASVLIDQQRLRARLLETFLAHQQQITALRLPLLLLFTFSSTAWLVFLVPSDVAHYQCYALAFWSGSRAAAMLPTTQCAFLGVSSPQAALYFLPLEYPPLALVPFSLPLLLPQPYYALTFALLMLGMVCLIYWLLARFHSTRAAISFLLYLALGASVLVQVRYDVLPAACMLICLLAAERKYWRVSYTALAIGALLKLYPLIALPAVFLAEQEASGQLHPLFITYFPGGWDLKVPRWGQRMRQIGRWRWKHLMLFGGILAGVTGGFALLNPQAAVVGPVQYLLQRPVQIETLESSFLWLAQYVGVPFQVVSSYQSLNILSPLANPAAWVDTGLGILGCLFVFRLQWKQQLPLGQAMIALLCLVISTGKVFSPQYLIWLMPFVAYVGAGRIWHYGWGIVLACTTVIYIGYYSQLHDPATAAQTIQTLPGFFEVVTLRNGVFGLMTLAYLFNWFQARHSSRHQLAPAVSVYNDAAAKSRTQLVPAEKRR